MNATDTSATSSSRWATTHLVVELQLVLVLDARETLVGELHLSAAEGVHTVDGEHGEETVHGVLQVGPAS